MERGDRAETADSCLRQTAAVSQWGYRADVQAFNGQIISF